MIDSINVTSTEALCIAKNAQSSTNQVIQELNNTNDVLVKSIVKEKENFNYLNCKINNIELLLKKCKQKCYTSNYNYDSDSSCSSNKSESDTNSNYFSDNLSIHSSDINLDYLIPNKKHKKKHRPCSSKPCTNSCSSNPCTNSCSSNPCTNLIYVLRYTPLQRNVCNYVKRINPHLCNS
jgi:hypothetical protein